MPRDKRKISKTKIYHVMTRALNKQMLFDDEKDYLRFLSILKALKQDYEFEIFAYCLMGNHVHILLKDKKENLSKVMNVLSQRYAMYYNKKNNRTGYVFNDRYHSEVVESKEYFFTCIRYIHQNPVNAAICKKTFEYKFSSIHAYRKKSGNYLDLVNVESVQKIINNEKFLSWNESTNFDVCMDVIEKNANDNEVLKKLLLFANVYTRKHFNELPDAKKEVCVLKLLDQRIPIKQLSRVSGMSYGKIQKLRKGIKGSVKSLTYYKSSCF